MRPVRFLFRLVATGAALGLAGCEQDVTSPESRPAAPSRQAASASENVVLQWDNAALHAIRVTKPGPPIVARALAIVHTAMYDAWVAYDDHAVGTRLGGTLRRPLVERTLVNKSEAVSFAAYRALVDLFPTQTSPFNDLMASLGYDPANPSTDVATSAGIGNVAAAAVIGFRHHDGANQLGDL
ncbi:MAG TPA: hypothetical protein VGJ36_02925, partial [Gemmatimonadales bacterium]